MIILFPRSNGSIDSNIDGAERTRPAAVVVINVTRHSNDNRRIPVSLRHSNMYAKNAELDDENGVDGDNDNEDDDDDDDHLRDGDARVHISNGVSVNDSLVTSSVQKRVDLFQKDRFGTVLGCVKAADGEMCSAKQGCDFFNSCCYSSWSRLGDFAGYPLTRRSVRAIEYMCPGSIRFLGTDGCT